MMQKYLVLILSFMLVLSLSVRAENPQGVLKGRIFDSQTKEGLGGIQIFVKGENTKQVIKSDDFGYFILKLEPGQYVAQIEQLDQKIGFVILPEKTALLEVPLKATDSPKNEKIAYSVKYSKTQEETKTQEQPKPQAAEPQPKKVQPFIVEDQQKQETAQEAPAETKEPAAETNSAQETSNSQETSTTEKEYPMKGMVASKEPAVKPGKNASTIAIVEFKDSTEQGLGLMAAKDVAQYLFDLGSVKVVGPDSVSGAIGGEPADPLNGAFAQWVSKKLGADVVVIGHLKVAKIEHHQYLFIVAAKAVMTTTVQVMDSKTGNLLSTFTETGASGMSGTSSGKERYYNDKARADLFEKASKDMAKKLGDHLLQVVGQLKSL